MCKGNILTRGKCLNRTRMRRVPIATYMKTIYNLSRFMPRVLSGPDREVPPKGKLLTDSPRSDRFPSEQGREAKTRCDIEPEKRLWKVGGKAVWSSRGEVELALFLICGIVAAAVLVYCFAELFQLLSNGTMDHTVQAILTR
jgi:hypothetical protein